MTTRRRRTGSETGCEAISGNIATIVPSSDTSFFSQFKPQVIKSSLLEADAIYKKTDSQPYDHCEGADVLLSNVNFSKETNLTKHPLDHHRFPPPSFNLLTDPPEFEDMASRDRSQEFVRIIRSQKGNLVNGNLPHQKEKKPKDLRNYTDFMQRAKLIGRNISSTYAKLDKLTHLAKKRSLFDDSQDHEIQELTGIIRHDLNSLTKQLEDLQNKCRMAGSTLNGTSPHLQKHSANLVGTLQTKVANITQKFKDVLEVRTQSLKKQAERREQFAGGIVSGQLPPEAVVGHHQGSVLLADDAAASAARSRTTGFGEDHTTISMGYDGESEGDGLQRGAVYQQQLELMEEQDAYLQSRADTMKTIESTIVELGQMFTQLATMVKEQEEIVHRIDSNVDEADMNIEAAHTEILKYFKSVSSNRWLMMKVFGILIVFFVIFIVFMA